MLITIFQMVYIRMVQKTLYMKERGTGACSLPINTEYRLGRCLIQ